MDSEYFTKQDAIILNLQRSCEASIDMAMHVVRLKKLGVPQESREAFLMLGQAGIIPQPLAERMTAMVGFRNVAVHDDRRLNLDVVESIIRERLGDFVDFSKVMLNTKV